MAKKKMFLLTAIDEASREVQYFLFADRGKFRKAYNYFENDVENELADDYDLIYDWAIDFFETAKLIEYIVTNNVVIGKELVVMN